MTAAPTISLRPVTKENFEAVYLLRVRPDQESFVATNVVSLAQAYVDPRAWVRAIYADEQPVGFLMLVDEPERAHYFLWRFMIGAEHQGRGYGRAALEQLIAHVRTRPGARKLGLSYHDEPGGPGPFYRRLGFEDTDEIVDGERVMWLQL